MSNRPEFVFPIAKLLGIRARPDRGFRADDRSINILVVRLDRIGDVILTLPFLHGLRQLYPNAKISVLVTPSSAGILASHEWLNLIICNVSITGFLGHPRTLLRALFFAKRYLWIHDFDLAINPRYDFDMGHSGLLCFLSKAPVRIAFSETVLSHKKKSDRNFDRWYTKTLVSTETMHEIERSQLVLKELGGKGELAFNTKFPWLPSDHVTVGRILNEIQTIPPRRLVAFGIGASSANKNWPIERFISVATVLRKEFNLISIFFGSAEDQNRFAPYASIDGLFSAFGLGLRESALLMTHCSFFVGTDSANCHLAALAGIPTVVVSCHPLSGDPNGSLSPKRFHPWVTPRIVIQPNAIGQECQKECNQPIPHCILGIEPEAVISQILDLMNLDK